MTSHDLTSSPSAPSAPYLKELTVTGIRLNASWNEPEQKNGILNGYLLSWTDSQGTQKSLSFDNSTLSYTINDLKRCETYTVVVQAETLDGGFGPNSNERIANITNSGIFFFLLCFLFVYNYRLQY